MNFDSFVLAAATDDLADEPAAREHADAVEFRMDLSDSGPEAVADYDGDLPLIVTNRVVGEGGEAPDEPERLAALQDVVDLPHVGAVDVELAACQSGEADDLLATAADADTAVIVSAHDFEATPSRAELETTLEAACEHGTVGKFATTAEGPADVLALLAATRAVTEAGGRVATMAMGEPGRHSRAVAPLYGSRIGYAPVDPASATAPGQFDLATLADLIETLRDG